MKWCPRHERWEHPDEARYEESKTAPAGRVSKEVEEPFAVATWQAQQMGYSDFAEGSPGRKKRDEIAETLKKNQPQAMLRSLQRMEKRLAQ